MAEAEGIQYGVVVMPKGGELMPNGRPKLAMCLQATTPSAVSTFYLCDVIDNYQDIAQKFSDMINQAGREGRRAQSGLIAVEGGSDGFRTRPGSPQQGGKHHRPSPEGA